MQKEISVIVPIHNDADVISGTIDSILDFFNKENLDGELIVVNDGGTKEGVEIVENKIKNGSNVIFISRNINKGKGYSVKEGIEKSTGEVTIFTDADLPYGTESIKKIYEKIFGNEFDFVLANRNLSGKQGMKQATMVRKIAHAVYSLFAGSLMLNFSDVSAGLKGMNRKVVEAVMPKITINRFAFDIELILLVKKFGFRIGEIPVVLQQISKSKNLSVIFDSPQMIFDVLKIVLRNWFGFYKDL